MTSLKTICGWCLIHMKGPQDAQETSHGLCDVCAKGVEGLTPRQRESFLAKLEARRKK